MNSRSRRLSVLCDAIVSVVAASGEAGVPGGTLYTNLKMFECDPQRFEAILRALVATRQLTRRGELYFDRRVTDLKHKRGDLR